MDFHPFRFVQHQRPKLFLFSLTSHKPISYRCSYLLPQEGQCQALWGLPHTGNVGNGHNLSSCDRAVSDLLLLTALVDLRLFLETALWVDFTFRIMDLPWLADAMQKKISDTCSSGIVDIGTLMQWLNANSKDEKDFRCHFWVTFIYCGIHEQSARFILHSSPEILCESECLFSLNN